MPFHLAASPLVNNVAAPGRPPPEPGGGGTPQPRWQASRCHGDLVMGAVRTGTPDCRPPQSRSSLVVCMFSCVAPRCYPETPPGSSTRTHESHSNTAQDAVGGASLFSRAVVSSIDMTAGAHRAVVSMATSRCFQTASHTASVSPAESREDIHMRWALVWRRIQPFSLLITAVK